MEQENDDRKVKNKRYKGQLTKRSDGARSEIDEQVRHVENR